MLSRSSLFLLLAATCYGQTVITELGSFWEAPSTTTGNVIWDYHGSRHAFATGYGVEQPATIFGGGIRQNPSSVGGASVPASKLTLSGTFTIAVWVRNNGANAILSKWGNNGKQFFMRFTGSPGRPDVYFRLEDGTDDYLATANTAQNTISSGGLALVWFSFDSVTGAVKIACNSESWASKLPASPFKQGVSAPLDIGNITQNSSRGTTVGRFMYWPGYIPSDAERTDVYNGGLGRDYTYFKATGFNPPVAPITDISYQGVFADDANLTGEQGLYWLQPYPLSHWSPALAASFGNKLWLRSTDHGPGGVYIGYSANPDTLPVTWSQPVTAAQLNTADPGPITWEALELPTIVWDEENSRLLLYAKARNAGSPSLRATHVWESTNLATWTWLGIAFPYGQVVDGIAINYSGYPFVKRVGAGDWRAQTLINDSPNTRYGTWTSADGVTWTFQSVTTCQTTPLAYVTAMCENSFLGATLAGSIIGGGTNKGYAAPSNTFAAINYPPIPIVEHDGAGGTWLQSLRAYEEGGTVWLYAKWSYQEPSTVRLYKGTLPSSPQSFSSRFGGAARISGAASMQ